MKTPSLCLIAAACFIAPASVAHARSAYDGSWDLAFVTQKGTCDPAYNFATERGWDGYEKYRHDFAKLIWQLASPKWNFDDATFDRSAASFDNPDHVGIVIHNYRWRLGLAEGEPKYDELEQRLAADPAIAVPTITLEGDANGAPHPEPSAYAKMFSDKYAHRTIAGGIGHNLPQEAPQAFAQAVMDVAGF
jgi:pimeloyl-ACP methyl ester carboxylesterase